MRLSAMPLLPLLLVAALPLEAAVNVVATTEDLASLAREEQHQPAI